MSDSQILKRTADTVRMLSADAVQKANSGHPGMPLGNADLAVTLFAKWMRINPQNPGWIGRDRFVLSAGHGSMLLYSLLHLFGYGLSLDELKNFRQWGSLTPGHPEFGHTAGVDITTGPLGSGISSAVGMAMAEKNFEATAGLDQSGLAMPRIFVLCGDGCMMEGSTQEAASLAGHLKLDNLIVFYDSNRITIEGSTDLAFSEDVGARFAAMGWRVLTIDNANSADECDRGMAAAVAGDGRPTLVICRTQIGFGSPNKAGKASTHGEPLGAEEVEAMRAALDMPEAFTVPAEVRAFCDSCIARCQQEAAAWDAAFQKFVEADADRAARIAARLNRTVPDDLEEELLKAVDREKPVATRVSGGVALNRAAQLVPALFGGAADLAPSTKTAIKDGGDFLPGNYAGRNCHFGVRELGMAMAGNGMALQGTVIPFTSTFFVFSDYMKPAIRLAALQKLHEIYIFTHDSFYVGEDGPTHEPVEQIAMLRTIPGVTVMRPAEANEVAQCYAAALRADGPVAVLLSRQNLAPFPADLAKNVQAARGGYILRDCEDFDLILVATGSEVNLALEVADKLKDLEIGARVVSMPSQELFLQQDEEYREEVLPFGAPAVSIEAGSTYGWERIIGGGLSIGLDHFGASAPCKKLAEEFGFTADAVINRIFDYYDTGDCGCGEDDCHCGGDCDCDDDCDCGCHDGDGECHCHDK